MRTHDGRAPRFSLALAVRFRPVGAGSWSEGLTENVSRSGVLFHAGRLLPVGTPLEMAIALPATPGSPEILCRGRVVRASAAGADGRPVLAATIAGYRFVRDAAA
jgi:hypothetical protein